MNSTQVTVVAILKAKAGQEDKVRDLLLTLIGPSRKDAGCLNYDLHQGRENKREFMFHENWTSKDMLDAHLAKPDLQGVLGKVVPLLSEPPQILLWDRIA